MTLLVDTHIFLWTINDDPRLKSSLREAITRPGNKLYFSYASLWEAGIKIAQGRLSVPGASLNYLLGLLRLYEFELLPITLEHLQLAATLPFHHGDPFDRMIAAQAIAESLQLVTEDTKLHLYDVSIFTAS